MENSEALESAAHGSHPSTCQHAVYALDAQQLQLILAIQFVPGVGAKILQGLLDVPDSIDALLQGSGPVAYWAEKAGARAKSNLLGFLKNPRQAPEWEAAARTLDWLKRNRGGVTYRGAEDYPPALDHIDDPPPLLYWQGNVLALSAPSISIVGTRRPTPLGRSIAARLASDLAESGFSIVSGLAMGIDASAHRAALDCAGQTVAVLPPGLDRPAPSINHQLARDIVSGGSGCLVSELPLSTPPSKGYFPRRNRIVSGLSAAVIVVEAEIKSGTLITAKLALEQNREVFAVPGSLANPLTKGCHKLIKEGATLIESSGDVLEAIAGFTQRPIALERPNNIVNPGSSLSAEQQRLLGLLDDTPEAFELIAERSHLSLMSLTEALLDLELLGYVVSDAGCYARARQLDDPSSESV